MDLSTFPKMKVTEKDVEREIGIFSGKWNEMVLFEDEPVINFLEEFPLEVDEYPCPLPSDSYNRGDLQALIAGDIEEAQNEKETLEDIQRNDRKLRKKYHG